MTDQREVVLTKRDVDARLVPAGTEIVIPRDSFVTITQSLGGTFSVAVNGNLARIAGKDADALGKEPIQPFTAEDLKDGKVSEHHAWEAMRGVFDPEIPVNVVDLGLIYRCEIIPAGDKQRIEVDMTLTSAGCGMGPVIADDVKQKLMELPNVEDVQVNLVFDPPWSNDRLSDEAKLELGLF